MKGFLEQTLAVFGILWIVFSPFVVLASCILSTVKWYYLSNSVFMGILGMVVGGITSGAIMGLGIVAIAGIVYLIKKEEE